MNTEHTNWNGQHGEHQHVDTHDAPVPKVSKPTVSIIMPNGERVSRLTVAEAITMLRSML